MALVNIGDGFGGELSFNWPSGASPQINLDLSGGLLVAAFPSGNYTVLGVASAGTSGQILQSNGSGNLPTWINSTSGTVTSITFTGDGTVLSSTPSAPVTTSGTLTATLNSQSANTVLAGPTSGSAANPTFRSLVATDVPTLNQNTTGTASGITSGNANAPGCAAYASSSSTVLNANGYTKITLDSTLFNIGSFFDTSTSRFTPTKAGLYMVSFGMHLNTGYSSSYNYGAVLYKNGSAYVFGTYTTTNDLSDGYQSVGSAVVSMNGSTDYIELYGANADPSNSVTTFNGAEFTFLQAVYLGPNS